MGESSNLSSETNNNKEQDDGDCNYTSSDPISRVCGGTVYWSSGQTNSKLDSTKGQPLIELEIDELLLLAPEQWRSDMKAIAWCESRWKPDAISDGGNSLGLFQLWTGWFKGEEDPFNPQDNTRVAIRVREIRGRFGGAGGWTCADILGIP